MASKPVNLRKLADELRRAIANMPGFSWTLVGSKCADALEQVVNEHKLPTIQMPDTLALAREKRERELVARLEPDEDKTVSLRLMEALQEVVRTAKEHSPEWVVARRAINDAREEIE